MQKFGGWPTHSRLNTADRIGTSDDDETDDLFGSHLSRCYLSWLHRVRPGCSFQGNNALDGPQPLTRQSG
jgi:hypothetical protein